MFKAWKSHPWPVTNCFFLERHLVYFLSNCLMNWVKPNTEPPFAFLCMWPHKMWASFLKSCSRAGYLGLDNWLNLLPVKEGTGRDKCGLEPLIGLLVKVFDWDQRWTEADMSMSTSEAVFEPLFKVLALNKAGLCCDIWISLSPCFKGDYWVSNYLGGSLTWMLCSQSLNMSPDWRSLGPQRNNYASVVVVLTSL